MEKKKIMARKPSSAEEQEKALQLLMHSTPSVPKEEKTPAEIKPKPVKTPRKPATPKRASILAEEKVTEKQRITIDLPLDVYEALKKEVENSGTTMKWQIVKLLRENLRK